MQPSPLLRAFAICLSLLAWSASGRAESLPDSSAAPLDRDAGIPSLTETTWQLTELRGEPLAVAAGTKRPHLTLKAQGSQVQGFGGCNSFTGPYELNDGNRIKFGVLAATMMACPEMEVESRLFEVLGMTDNYALTRQGLSLHRARMAPLARFEVIPAP
jgi:heat shock protein HslJ